MGEQFIKKHTEQFQHQQDAAFRAELATRTLFSERPEVYDMQYTCRLLQPGPIQVGAFVCVQVSPSGVEVYCGHEILAVIEGAAAVQLQSILQSDPRAGGMMKARIESQQLLGGGFNIRCAE